jgi:hypothetical protein
VTAGEAFASSVATLNRRGGAQIGRVTADRLRVTFWRHRSVRKSILSLDSSWSIMGNQNVITIVFVWMIDPVRHDNGRQLVDPSAECDLSP